MCIPIHTRSIICLIARFVCQAKLIKPHLVITGVCKWEQCCETMTSRSFRFGGLLFCW